MLLAEVVSDTVIACKADGSGESTWQEVEVEQGAGGQELADAIESVLLDAGLERSASPSKLKRALGTSVTPYAGHEVTSGKASNPRILLRNYLIEQLRALVAADLGTRRADDEAVHDFRVAARRIRSALQSYAGHSPKTDDLITDLRWIGGKFGDARDVEVQWERLVERLGEIDEMPEREAVRARIDEFFSARGETAQETALEALDSERYTTLLDRLDEYVATSNSTPPPTASERRHRHESWPIPCGTWHTRSVSGSITSSMPIAAPSVTSECTAPAREPSG